MVLRLPTMLAMKSPTSRNNLCKHEPESLKSDADTATDVISSGAPGHGNGGDCAAAAGPIYEAQVCSFEIAGSMIQHVCHCMASAILSDSVVRVD